MQGITISLSDLNIKLLDGSEIGVELKKTATVEPFLDSWFVRVMTTDYVGMHIPVPCDTKEQAELIAEKVAPGYLASQGKVQINIFTEIGVESKYLVRDPTCDRYIFVGTPNDLLEEANNVYRQGNYYAGRSLSLRAAKMLLPQSHQNLVSVLEKAGFTVDVDIDDNGNLHSTAGIDDDQWLRFCGNDVAQIFYKYGGLI
jgi:hypothetical protein